MNLAFLYSEIMSKKIIVPFLVFALFLSFTPLAFAQSGGQVQSAATLGVARIVQVKDMKLENGTIVSTTEGGAAIASAVPYDSQVLGVVSRDAAIILTSNTATTGLPIISNGTVYVLVTNKEGPIKKGDLITTSTTPGVAVKADNAGYVLGAAQEEYNSPTPGLIVAELDLHYFNSKPTFIGTLTDIFKLAILPTKDSPTPIFKYIVAAAVVLGSFVLGFLSFGRTAAKGVEALGRNPAASRIIHLGIIFNVGIVVVIVSAGLVVAFLILRL